MSDVESSTFVAPKGPKSRSFSYSARQLCRNGRDCDRRDCRYAHPGRDESFAPRESWNNYNRGRNTAHQEYDAYRPGAPLKPLNTNIGYASDGPRTTSSILTEPRAISRPPRNEGAKDRRHERRPSVKSPTVGSREADRPSIPQGDNTTNAQREVRNNDVATTTPGVDSMEVDLPEAEQQVQRTDDTNEAQRNVPASKPVALTTEENVQQATDVDKQTKNSEHVDENEIHQFAQKSHTTNTPSESDPQPRHSESSEDLDVNAMSFGDVLSAVIEMRILINEMETRKRHSQKDLLSYENTIQKHQQIGKDSAWREPYELEKRKLQQIEGDLVTQRQQFQQEFVKMRILMQSMFEKAASTANKEQEIQALKTDNTLLREKLEYHGKSIQALQEQLREMQSPKFITTATEPLTFRVERLEGTVSKAINARLEEEADHDKTALDQHNVNIVVQQDLRVLKGNYSGVSEQLSTLTSHQTQTSVIHQNTEAKLQNFDAQLQNILQKYDEFMANILKRIQDLERLTPRENGPDIGTGAFVAFSAERDLTSPSPSNTNLDADQRTTALEVQLVGLRQRLDNFTMDEHLGNIVQAIQQIWHPQSGTMTRRMDDLEQNWKESSQKTRQWAEGLDSAVRAKVEAADLPQLRKDLNDALSTATVNRRLVENLSKALTEERAKDEDTKQEIAALNTSMARISTLQTEDNAKFERFVSEFNKVLEQQTQSDGSRDQSIQGNAQSAEGLLSRIDRLEQRLGPQFDTRPSKNVWAPNGPILNLNETSRGPISTEAPQRLGSFNPKNNLKRKNTEGSEQKHRNGRR